MPQKSRKRKKLVEFVPIRLILLEEEGSVSPKQNNIAEDIFDDGTTNDTTAAQPSKAKDQKPDDTKYGVCEGRKISRILGLNTTSSELRMLVVYSDAKKVHKKDAELVPSRILRHYAPQMVIDYYESLIIKGSYE
ncbi:chromo shadow domain protein [Ancylostoma duodenale]|uniref:Chromo shadow domain protein n=1 Tax=Ancylostoma duodenale TaxID=51022 RepID=A0A0C2FQ41_9BILA|nr:chromo shadow domain protein [Ancylostoma duodenale]